MAVVWNHFFCCDSGIGARSSVRENLAAFYRKRTRRRDVRFGGIKLRCLPIWDGDARRAPRPRTRYEGTCRALRIA